MFSHSFRRLPALIFAGKSLAVAIGARIVCVGDLPPSAASKARYIVKKLRAAEPDLEILVGRWAPPALADDSVQPIRDAGADHVAATLLETREKLEQIVSEMSSGLPQKAAVDAA